MADRITTETSIHELRHDASGLEFRAIHTAVGTAFEVACPEVAGRCGACFSFTRRFALELRDWIDREFDAPFEPENHEETR